MLCSWRIGGVLIGKPLIWLGGKGGHLGLDGLLFLDLFVGVKNILAQSIHCVVTD